MNDIILFFVHWGITALSLWAASFVFRGISFTSKGALFSAALFLGLANAIIRPVIIVLTIPLTIVTFGFFLLVINALMMLLVSSLVSGFKVSGFWTAFFASIFIALLSFFVGFIIFQSSQNPIVVPNYRGLTVALAVDPAQVASPPPFAPSMSKGLWFDRPVLSRVEGLTTSSFELNSYPIHNIVCRS